MAFDLTIDVENTPGALAEVASAISDAGVNLAAATCIDSGERAELHILVPHPEAVRHALAIARLAVPLALARWACPPNDGFASRSLDPLSTPACRSARDGLGGSSGSGLGLYPLARHV